MWIVDKCKSLSIPTGRFLSLFSVSSSEKGQSEALRTEQDPLQLVHIQYIAQGHNLLDGFFCQLS